MLWFFGAYQLVNSLHRASLSEAAATQVLLLAERVVNTRRLPTSDTSDWFLDTFLVHASAHTSSDTEARVGVPASPTAPLSDHIIQRLDEGRVASIKHDADSVEYWWRMSDGRVLSAHIPDQARFAISPLRVGRLLQHTFDEQSLRDWQQAVLLDTDVERPPYHAFVLRVSDINDQLTAAQLDRLQRRDSLLVMRSPQDQTAWLLLDADWVLKINYSGRWPAMYGLVMVLLSLAGVVLFGLLVNWMLHSFQRRLRQLERATQRLSEGYLTARVGDVGNDPVSLVGRSFNTMAEHIQRLIDVQREMMRAVSHELRTPVARIRFAAQIIEDTVDESDFLQKQLHGIDSDIQELDELIDEILTYARLEQGGPILDFNAVNVAALAVQVVNEARPQEGVTVSYCSEPPDEDKHLAEIESRYIHRAVQNLVGNACRYAKSTVRVSCSMDEHTCRIDIEDDGAGIPEEQWERVFTPFARLDDSRTRSSGGYGLGLSIVKRIVFWHGGEAKVRRSDALGGAKFSLVWPRQQLK